MNLALFSKASNRRLLFFGLIFTALATLISSYYWFSPSFQTVQNAFSASSNDKCSTPTPSAPSSSLSVSHQDEDEWDPKHWLTGNKTFRFEDNLRSDVHYITAGCCGGFTNLFIGLTNLLYLASITDRVPILLSFSTAANIHVGLTTPNIRFSDVFDLPDLRKTLRMPILEWDDVKHLSEDEDATTTPEPEQIGCWSTSLSTTQPGFGCFSEHELNLDVSYTRSPKENRNPNGHSLMYSLAALIYPTEERGDEYPLWTPAKKSGHIERPNKHLECFDDIYYVTTNSQVDFECFYKYSPQWRMVQRHVKFNKGMLDIANEYVGNIFGVTDGEVPSFITVHIRHGDFSASCEPESGNKLDCFAPLSEWAKLVQEVQQELNEKKQLDAQRVIVASDEEDPLFLDEVKKLGWETIDHKAMDTMGKYGNEWYPPIIDTIILSMGAGFVGTSSSTFSLMAKKRVEDWNGGVAREHSWNP